MTRTQITCAEADRLRRGLHPLSSITNYVGGEVLDHRLPPHTATTWGLNNGTEILDDRIDEDGCRHWRITPEPQP